MSSKGSKGIETNTETDIFDDPCDVSLSLKLVGENPGPGDWGIVIVFNGAVLFEGKWENGEVYELDALPINLKDSTSQSLFADTPLVILLRILNTKSARDPDPLLNPDNRAGGTIDLLPLVIGESEIYTRVRLLMITTEKESGCVVDVLLKSSETIEVSKIPLIMCVACADCLPPCKEGTVYIGAIALDVLTDPVAVQFGMSLGSRNSKRLLWSSISHAGNLANTFFYKPSKDKFFSQPFEVKNTISCNSAYWYAFKRVLVDPVALFERLSSPFYIEFAGVPKSGKIEIRGRYMGFVDAGVLSERGQYGVTTCSKLMFFNESRLPENISPLLDLPPSSAKASARETDNVTDEYGHIANVTIRFDVHEPIVPKSKIADLFERIGYPPPEGLQITVDELYAEFQPEDPVVDVKRVRKEGGALAVHKELSNFSCRGSIPMNQTIKRTAANRLLTRVRTMIKQFPLDPGFTQVDFQEQVTFQHAASRKAVTASFAPQPPPLRTSSRVAGARCRLAGDHRIADIHLQNNLKIANAHPRPLLAKVLRCLEEQRIAEAREYLVKGFKSQPRNRFILWTFAAQEFDKPTDDIDPAIAAFRIALKGDFSDGTANAIGWAGLHAIHHYHNEPHAAFVAAKKMRKAYELPIEWEKFYARWIETSGQEEIYWIPTVVCSKDPMLIAAAFFLCLRCFKFSETLLRCYEENCSVQGSRFGIQRKSSPDIFYIRAASLILRHRYDEALNIIDTVTKRFGPYPMLSQIRVTCLMCAKGWNDECAAEFGVSERAGAVLSPAILLQAALSGIPIDPHTALQRAARAHKLAPCAHSALVISRIYLKLGEEDLSERWAAAAVKSEPLLADGWAVLGILAMRERKVDKGRHMLRTAKQVGPISEEIESELRHLKDLLHVDTLPDSLVKDVCFCQYY